MLDVEVRLYIPAWGTLKLPGFHPDQGYLPDPSQLELIMFDWP